MGGGAKKGDPVGSPKERRVRERVGSVELGLIRDEWREKIEGVGE